MFWFGFVAVCEITRGRPETLKRALLGWALPGKRSEAVREVRSARTSRSPFPHRATLPNEPCKTTWHSFFLRTAMPQHSHPLRAEGEEISPADVVIRSRLLRSKYRERWDNLKEDSSVANGVHASRCTQAMKTKTQKEEPTITHQGPRGFLAKHMRNRGLPPQLRKLIYHEPKKNN